ncbi:MAG: alternative ribosome rescue aminoacyl-tRNA hydrolase ArfB [Flavobacteriaceae bacterium]
MNQETLLNELTFKATRSSGAGGQHVNKVSSRIELSFDLQNSQGLSEDEKTRLQKKLDSRLTKDGILLLGCSESRSQHRNKSIVIERFLDLIKENLKVKKPRKKSKPSKGAIEKRLKSKKNNALKKANRKPPKIN